jgi:Putative zinc-finger
MLWREAMSHVDEGLIHAYLDGAFPPGSQQGEEIEAHLEVCVDCRVLLEKAREVKDRAQLVMHRLAPPVVTAPPFDEILARRERSRAAAGGAPATPEPTASQAASRRRLLPPLPLAWAATLILAIGAGWMVRAYMAPAALGVATSTESEALDAAAPAPPAPALDDARLRLPPVTGEGSAASAAAEPPPAAPIGGRAEQGQGGQVGQTQRADLGADRGLIQAQRARAEAPPERRALASTVTTVQADTGARPVAAAPPPTVSLFGDAKATIQVAAESIDLASTTLPEADLLRAYARVTQDGTWVREVIAEPIRLIGYEAVARLEGAQAVRTERASGDVTELMRTVYAIDGDSVELIQRLQPMAVALNAVVVTGTPVDTTAANRRAVTARSGGVDTTAAGRAVTVTNEPTVSEAETTTRVIRPLRIAGGESAVFEGHGVVVVSEGGWQAVLKGPLDPARLQALAADVRR